MGKYVLGVTNIWAVKRFIEPEAWVEITATKMEVDHVQFMFDTLDPASDEFALDEMVTRTNDACKKYGVTIDSCFAGLSAYTYNLLMHPSAAMRRSALNWYSKAFRLASRLGAKSMGGPIGALSDRDDNDPVRRELVISDFLDSVRSLGWLGRGLGIEYMLLEPMPVPREPPSTIQECRAILERANKDAPLPVKLCIDVGHACNPESRGAEDHDPYVWLTQLGTESPVVHLQQTDGRTDRHWPFTAEYNRVGIIQPQKVISALDASGSSETRFYFECLGPFEQPVDDVVRDMVESVRYWKSFF